MASTLGAPSQSKYAHTDKIDTRRKALFPTDDTGSDLGHMSPIHSENSNFSDCAMNALEHEADFRFRKFFKYNLDDYVLLDNDAEFLTPDPCSETNVPSLYLSSPINSLLSTPILYSPMHTTKVLSPMSKSPSTSQKTPHDTSTMKVNLKQTKRKLVADSSDSLKESHSPNCKQAKIDTKSKVRTALFPEDEIVLPAKSFYPKDHCTFNAKESIAALVAASKQQMVRMPYFKRGQITKHNPVGAGNKRRYGEINAGVRHKIRKPKQKKVTQAKIIKATMNIIEKSPLTEYLEEMINVKKTIKPLPPNHNINNAPNKENIAVKCETVANRKFFKSLRTTIKQNTASSSKQPMQDQNKPLSSQKKVSKKTSEASSITPPNKRKVDTFDLSVEEESIVPEITNTIKRLEKSASTTKSDLNPNLIFSPTTQMCDMASALDLNSPKRAKLNINKMLNDSTLQRPKGMTTCNEKIEKSAKLFPLFYADKNKSAPFENSKKAVIETKKFKSVDNNQLVIDAGQKKFGAVKCNECGFMYETGDHIDEGIHRNFHDAINTFKFNGWKNERVVANIDLEIRVIKLIPGDSKVWWRKGIEVMEYINRELGFFDGVLPMEKSQMYLYIKNKKIIGCLTAEMKHTAYKRLPSDLDIDLCSEESYTIRCGISRIWVAPHQRRSGIASQMLDTLRRNFLHGYILNNNEIAMSSPTDQGQKFATKYFNTESFLIYMH